MTLENAPGLKNAGVMWAVEFTRFLKRFGFNQPYVDRRLFYMYGEESRALLQGKFVGDYKLVVQSEPLAARFKREWKKKFSDPPNADATARDFLGLKYGGVSAGAIEVSWEKVLSDLRGTLVGMSLVGSGSRCTTPLPEVALRQLKDGPGPGNELLPDSALPRARSILGLGGWVVGNARPDGLLGYAALTHRTSRGRLAQYA